METEKETVEKKSFKWILISFAVSYLLSGLVLALVIYIEEQQRPGLTENVWLEMFGVFVNPYLIVAGLIGVFIVGIFRLVKSSGGFSSGGNA